MVTYKMDKKVDFTSLVKLFTEVGGTDKTEDSLDISVHIAMPDTNPLYTLEYKSIIEGMFPDKEYKFLEQNCIRIFTDDQNYYDYFAIESIVYDYFIDDKNELLVALKS